MTRTVPLDQESSLEKRGAVSQTCGTHILSHALHPETTGRKGLFLALEDTQQAPWEMIPQARETRIWDTLSTLNVGPGNQDSSHICSPIQVHVVLGHFGTRSWRCVLHQRQIKVAYEDHNIHYMPFAAVSRMTTVCCCRLRRWKTWVWAQG